MRRLPALAGALTALAALSACGGSSPVTSSAPPAAGTQQVTLTTTDGFRFLPAVVHVHPGAVRFTVVNKGAYPHNLSFPGMNKTSATVTGGIGKQMTTIDVTFTSAGHYRFLCTYHDSAGMTGEVVVS